MLYLSSSILKAQQRQMNTHRQVYYKDCHFSFYATQMPSRPLLEHDPQHSPAVLQLSGISCSGRFEQKLFL